jgi:twitching motility protein PilJ
MRPIQASMAGDAGRGFAVVADEFSASPSAPPRPHARSRPWCAPFKRIRTAVVSMERSTTDVVGGALLAENAGAALEEIEQVSNQIPNLVQNIFASSRQQVTEAQKIARNMQVLKEISTQTAESTTATSQSISKLAQLSAAMRQSASGFRLPGAPVPRQVAAAGAAIAAAAAATTGVIPAQPSSGSTQRTRTISLAS